MSVELDFVNR
jgi:hypothetical protein